MKVGKIALVISGDIPHGQWPLGCIVEVDKGDDGCVQDVKVQVIDSVVTCLVTKICPLEVNEGSQNITTVSHERGE